MRFKFKIGQLVKCAKGFDYFDDSKVVTNVTSILGMAVYSLDGVGGLYEEELLSATSGPLYKPTIDTSGWSNDQFSTLHRGQWVSNFGATGQFLGITARGTVTINYKQTKDLRKQYAANQPLRRFVLLHGGK